MTKPRVDAPLIVTLQLDAVAQDYFNALRRQHFPVERNFLDAHLTLFHALPAELLPRIAEALRRCSDRRALVLQVRGVRPLGRGVAFAIDCQELIEVREDLARHFAQWLTPQDAQGFRPHITVQNKVTSQAARTLLDELQSAFVPFSCMGEALSLWRYAGGPWTPICRFDFVMGSSTNG